jgi:tripartite-type tricarboxylate transporter receptor subunit TctC
MRLNQLFALKVVAVLTSILSLYPLQGSAAEKFPVKPVQVIIPFQPGDTDNLLRPFIERMGEFLGQPLSLVYKPGAAGAVGAGFVATSKPDGYVLVGTSHSSVAVVPLTNKQVAYSLDSFEPVACLVESGSLLVVLSSSPWLTFKDMIEASKKAPGKVTYTSSGTFGTNHLIPEGLAKEAGVKWNHIPSQGSGPAITATLGGHVNMASTAVAPAAPHIKAGTLRPLASYGNKRLQAFPDVPTLQELGYTIASPSYYGILAPKGTPKAVVDAIYAAAQKAVETYNAQISTRLEPFGVEIKLLGPEEYKTWLKGQSALFSGILKSMGN